MHLLDCRCPFIPLNKLLPYSSFRRARRADRRPAGVMTVPVFWLMGVPLFEMLEDFSGDLNVTSGFASPFLVTPKMMAMTRITTYIGGRNDDRMEETN